MGRGFCHCATLPQQPDLPQFVVPRLWRGEFVRRRIWLSSSARFMTRFWRVFPAVTVPGVIFQDACSWLELAVVAIGGSEERAEFRCRVLHRGRQKDFLGFCRARNAVIEATILATRLGLHDRDGAADILNQYMKVVDKTGSEIEKQAFQLVCKYVEKQGE